MDLFRNRMLLYPVAFVLGLFFLDKIFLIPEVRDEFIQPGGMMYYRQRLEQLKELPARLKKNQENKKTIIVLGDSRAFAIGNEMLPDAMRAKWDIVNFAGPQAVMGYHDFLTGKILQNEPAPGYVIFSASPDAFNRNSGVFGRPVLAYGVDALYLKENETLIPERDLETWHSTRRYALAGMQFSFKDFFRRLNGSLFGKTPQIFLPGADAAQRLAMEQMLRATNPTLALYSFKRSPERSLLDQGSGAQYAWWGSAEPEKLKEDTDRIVKLYLANYVVSQEQLFFFRRTVERLRHRGIQVIVFWPRVNPYLLEAIDKEPKVRALWDYISAISREAGADVLDLNRTPETACTQYYDASHLSVACFPAITSFLVQRFDRH